MAGRETSCYTYDLATINPEIVKLRDKIEDLEKRFVAKVEYLEKQFTALEKASDWRCQFFAVALPIMLSIFISVGIAVFAQTSRFESLATRFLALEERVATVEHELKRVQIDQAEMKKDIEQLKTDVAEIKRDVKTLLSRSR